MKTQNIIIKTSLNLVMTLFMPLLLWAQNPYITIWQTDAPNTDQLNQIIIPASGEYNYYWEEVNDANIHGSGSGVDQDTIIFPHAGKYRLEMTPTGSNPFHRIMLNTYSNGGKLQKITQWGDVSWSSFESAYSNTLSLKITATDIPILDNVTNMASAFKSSRIDSVPNMGDWNVSHVTNMHGMFVLAGNFNEPIGNWDVSQVQDMSHMFMGAFKFNQPIGNWDVSQVTQMQGMFMGANKFNQELKDWNVSQVTNMSGMFEDAKKFNKPIDKWDVSQVEDMSAMFRSAYKFNQPLNGWDVSNVQDMSYMFATEDELSRAKSTAQNSYWVTDFNQSLNNWNVSQVINMEAMFWNAINFNQSLDKWELDSLENATTMLTYSGLNCSNYSLSIKAWANYNQTPTNISLGASELEFSPDISTAHDYLTEDLHWSIHGDLMGTCTLQVNHENFENIAIYPNPATDLVYISNLSGSETIILFDLNGNQLKTLKVNQTETQLNVENLSAGIYFIRIEGTNQTTTKKLILK